MKSPEKGESAPLPRDLYLQPECTPPTPKQIHDELRRLDAHMRPLLGRCRLDEFDRRDIERLRDDITIGKAAGTTKTKARGFARVGGEAGAATRTVRLSPQSV